ncbi:MAG: Permease of the drug/metabolite transporter (DMT) superfamily [Chloroflexi bacterium]|jgi:drug/metabolite transporter (DMT)-like permease|nr:MAG: Permease of the drug/metabolite transporter (DMT) superfamily [Chloroflexota bacterium]
MGVLFGILSAASFSLNMIAVRRGVLIASATQGMYITIIGGVPLFALSALVTGQIFDIREITSWAWLYLPAAGIVHFNIGRYGNYQTVRYIGANASTPFRSLTPLFAVAMSIVFLDDSITALKGFGIGLIILAPLVMVKWGGRKAPAGGSTHSSTEAPAVPASGGPPVANTVIYDWKKGITWAVIASLAYGTSPLLVKAGLEESGLSLLGGTISYVAASMILILALVLPGRYRSVRNMPRGAIKYFVIGGFSVFFAQMFRYVGLAIAPVSTITPLQQTGAVWTVLFSFIFNRQTELFGARIYAAIFFSAIGALALVWPQ